MCGLFALFDFKNKINFLILGSVAIKQKNFFIEAWKDKVWFNDA